MVEYSRIALLDESLIRLPHADGRIRIWRHVHETIDLAYNIGSIAQGGSEMHCNLGVHFHRSMLFCHSVRNGVSIRKIVPANGPIGNPLVQAEFHWNLLIEITIKNPSFKSYSTPLGYSSERCVNTWFHTSVFNWVIRISSICFAFHGFETFP